MHCFQDRLCLLSWGYTVCEDEGEEVHSKKVLTPLFTPVCLHYGYFFSENCRNFHISKVKKKKGSVTCNDCIIVSACQNSCWNHTVWTFMQSYTEESFWVLVFHSSSKSCCVLLDWTPCKSSDLHVYMTSFTFVISIIRAKVSGSPPFVGKCLCFLDCCWFVMIFSLNTVCWHATLQLIISN